MLTRSFTLQDMCLQAVIRDLDFFIDNKAIILQKHTDFLFRAYSEEVFRKFETVISITDYREEISYRLPLPDNFLLWFLNPHVKKVVLINSVLSKAVIKQLLNIGPGIISLNLNGSDVSESDLNSIIAFLPHVVDLDLGRTSCSDETLKYIAKFCRDLKTLCVSFCKKVTDKGMITLRRSKLSLKKLNVLHTNVNDYRFVRCMPSLEYIKLQNVNTLLLKDGKKNIQYNITKLLYNDSIFSDKAETIRTIAKMCPKLKKLHLIHAVNAEILEVLQEFENLEELKIVSAYFRFSDVFTPFLPRANNLKTLILVNVNLSIVTLIEHFRNLETLFLRNVSFQPFKYEHITTTETKLHKLVIKDTEMKFSHSTYDAITLLISLSKNVTELHLKKIPRVPREIFNVILRSMKNLALVDFSNTVRNFNYIKQFLKMSSLETIIVPDVGIIHNRRAFPNSASCTLSWRSTALPQEDEDNCSDISDDEDIKICRHIFPFDPEDGSDNELVQLK